MENGTANLNPRYYRLPNPENWQGRHDGDELEDQRWHQQIQFWDLTHAKNLAAHGSPQNPVVLLGFACDEGVRRNKGRTGAQEGPTAIRKALANLPAHRNDIQLIDAGDITCPDSDLETAQVELGKAVHQLLNQGGFPILLGGGHEITYGHYLGIQAHLAEKKDTKSTLGIINFDAHFDNRKPEENGISSGTGFWQIAQNQAAQHKQQQRQSFHYLAIGIQRIGNTKALFDRAAQTGTQIILASDFHPDHEHRHQETIQHFLDQIDQLYLTIDLDVFASAYAPGVSATTALGLIPDHYFFKVLNTIIQSGKLCSVDFAELNPSLDQDQRTAKLTAALVEHIAHTLIC